MLRQYAVLGVAAALVWTAVATAHELDRPTTPILIETDCGLDDTVALAMALQAPGLELAGVAPVAGAADAATCTRIATQLLHRFNRSDIPLLPPVDSRVAADPAIRTRLRSLWQPLLAGAQDPHPTRSSALHGPVTVLALGPLTATARRLEQPHSIRQVVIAGPSDPAANWNLRADPTSWEVVRDSGVPLVFVAPDETASKPIAWAEGPGLGDGRPTSPAQQLATEVFAQAETRAHYLGALPLLFDELALMSLLQPELFEFTGPRSVRAADREKLLAAVADLLNRGRQPKDRVVFSSRPLPDSAFQEDVLARRDAIRANNGEDEWFAQLLLNELHEHLGAYSIIGVKMGLRAAELLNAPPHSMRVVSAAPPGPPVSCLNDGLLMATGSTPGRGLFEHRPEGAVRATFAFNGRELTLELRPEFRAVIAERITALRDDHGLEDPAYWSGVRALGLDIWQDWHRLDLFDLVATGTTGTPGEGSSE